MPVGGSRRARARSRRPPAHPPPATPGCGAPGRLPAQAIISARVQHPPPGPRLDPSSCAGPPPAAAHPGAPGDLRVTMEPILVAEAAAARAAEPIRRLEDNVAVVIRGKREVIRLATVCLLARGHVLIEDVPGVGKTTLAQALARSLGLSFQRIQFTSDLLPSDIIGVSIFKQKSQAFEFIHGPLFAHVVLADEINR